MICSSIYAHLKKSKLLSVIIQDALTQEVLGLENMDKKSYKKTTKEKRLYVYDAKSQKAIQKCTEEGKPFEMVELAFNSRGQILAQVRVQGLKATSWGCDNTKNFSLKEICDLLEQGKLKSKKGLLVSHMLQKGDIYLAKKLAEEAIELSLVAADRDENKTLILEEMVDLFYYNLLLCRAKGICFSEVLERLYRRA